MKGVNSCKFSQSRLVSVPLRGSGDERVFFRASMLSCRSKGFQSPCGEVVMKAFLFSVPMPQRVSVPLRGSGDERRYGARMAIIKGREFQSPCGEVVMKGAKRPSRQFFTRVSVPLRGSGDERGRVHKRKALEARFSPLAGKW